MAAWSPATRHVAKVARIGISSSRSYRTPQNQIASSLVHRRGMTSGGGGGGGVYEGSPKLNFWQDPMHPSKWKQEQFVVISLAGWGLVVYGGYKYLTRDKKDNTSGDQKVDKATH